ncbi:hypothetical protein V6U77_22845 [Micromonospora sp. CPCC 205546]|uniref:hypothetical protein n=1 Tax=Micromonospora sp. CPCC 205546 TaxID=3122397 RepID=UPI002FEF0283
MDTPKIDKSHDQEGSGLIENLLTAAVGFAAAALSFTHIHTFVMHNSPALTPWWFGWTTAIISEIVPIAAMMRDKRNKRIGAESKLPMSLFFAAVLFSLIANVAVAVQTPAGWLVSVFPAAMFLLLGKMVFFPAKKKALPIADAHELPIHKAESEVIPVPVEPAPPAMQWPTVPIGTRTLPIVPITAPVAAVPTEAVPVISAWDLAKPPAGSELLPIIPAQAPVPVPTAVPNRKSEVPVVPTDIKALPIVPISTVPIRKSRKRKPVVPAHVEKSTSDRNTNTSDPSELARKASELKSELGTWEKVAKEMGISARHLLDIRKAATA